jgi:hypothetical protein
MIICNIPRHQRRPSGLDHIMEQNAAECMGAGRDECKDQKLTWEKEPRRFGRGLAEVTR